MTDERRTRRRRRHPAAAGRILAAGVSASVTIGLSGVIAQAARQADEAAGKADVLQPTATSLQPRPIIVQLVPLPATPGLAGASQSVPPSTLAGSQPGVTALRQATVARVSRTTTPAAVVAARPVRTSPPPPPTTRPAPVTTSSGSKP
jgi:hypothetical protein